MGSPPEVHSALLNFNYGAGVGPMLDSASHHFELAEQYAQTALEVEQLLGTVQAEGWQGHAAEAFVTAYLPFLAWLIDASARSSEMAAKHELMAGAYLAALAAMPTEVELAANHVARAVLVATNFFGINTIPIAINEEQYVQMWVRAANTMATYDATSKSALSSMRPIGPAPPIRRSFVLVDEEPDTFDDFFGGPPTRMDNVVAEIQHTLRGGQALAIRLAGSPLLLTVALGGVVANLGAITGTALSGLTAVPSATTPAVVAPLAPLAAAPAMLTVAGVAPAVAAPGSSAALAPASASATGSAAAAAPPRATTPTSDRGAGPIGFAGTVHKAAVVEVAGLTTLAGDDFGGSATMPMLPGTWAPDPTALAAAR
ncbi:PPE family protein [Mycobacterium decipiens]|nr:PPE family protein [Mycobacterium decipiens]